MPGQGEHLVGDALPRGVHAREEQGASSPDIRSNTRFQELISYLLNQANMSVHVQVT